MKQLVNFKDFIIIKEAEDRLGRYLDSVYESVISENVGAAIGSVVKFTKIKNNAKKYQLALVQKALNNLDYEKKKQAAGGTVDKDKVEVLKAANAAKNQALTDTATAIADRMTDLATTPGLQKVKTLATSKAKVAAAETALKGADAEETKQLKIRIKELNVKAADAERAIKDYEKEGSEGSEEEETSQQAPPATGEPATGEPSKKDNAEAIKKIDAKISTLNDKFTTTSDSLNSRNHPDVLTIKIDIETAKLEKAKLEGDAEKIKNAEISVKTATANYKEAVKSGEPTTDPKIKELEADISNLEKELADTEKSPNKNKAGLDVLKAAIAGKKKSLDKLKTKQQESAVYIGESVADKFRYLMNNKLN
jgi:chromosome segregation ATPase